MGLFRRAASPAVGLRETSVENYTSRPSDANSLCPELRAPSSLSSGQSSDLSDSFTSDKPTILQTPSKKSKKGKGGNDAGHPQPPLPSNGIAAALLPSTQIATSSATPASPWAGYIDSSHLNRKAKTGLLSSKKSSKKLKREKEELEPFFPMSKIELEKLDVNLPSGKTVPHQHDIRPVKDYDSPANRLATASSGPMGSADFARFSVGGMLDIVDRNMAQEEADKARVGTHPQSGPSYQPAALYADRSAMALPSSFLHPRPAKSSQDELEVLSPAVSVQDLPSNRTRTATAGPNVSSAPGSRISVSSMTSEAATLRDEVIELLEVARKMSGSRNGFSARDSTSERGGSTYDSDSGGTKSLDRMKSTPMLRQPLANKSRNAQEEQPVVQKQAKKPNEAWQIVNTRVSKPHYGALTFPVSSSSPAISISTNSVTPRPPMHARKRSMSVPSALHIPPVVSLAARTGFLHPPKTYDESFFSSPRSFPRTQVHTRQDESAPSFVSFESTSTDGSIKSAPEAGLKQSSGGSGRIQLKRVPSSTTKDQLQLPATQRDVPRRLAAGHPGSGISAIQQYQYARYLVAPPAWSRGDDESHSAPIESQEAREDRRIRTNSDASVIDPFAALARKQKEKQVQQEKCDGPQPAPLRIQKSRPAELQPFSSTRNAHRGLSPSPNLSPTVLRPSRSVSPATSLSIGPPPQSPLPSLPPPNLPLPEPPRLDNQMPRLASRSPSPEPSRRAVSPSYSKENRPRPTQIPHATPKAPTRVPPAPPLQLMVPGHDLDYSALHEGQSTAARDYAFPSPSVTSTGSALRGLPVQGKKARPDTAQTMESLASYYSSSSDGPDTRSNAPASLMHYASSSTLSSAMGRPSLSLDGSNDTHFSRDSAITEVDSDAEEDERVRIMEEECKQMKSRFGWSRNRRTEKEDDEGYLGSPEQRNPLHDGVGHMGSENQYRQKSEYTVPIKHARPLEQYHRR